MDRFRDPDSDLGYRTMPNPTREELREMELALREHERMEQNWGLTRSLDAGSPGNP